MKLYPICLLSLFMIFGKSIQAQTEAVMLPKAGMTDKAVENLVRENVIENHGTPFEIVIEANDWTINSPNGYPEYKYLRVFCRYKDVEGKCHLIEYSVECSFDRSTSSFSSPYCRGNGYGEGLDMSCP